MLTIIHLYPTPSLHWPKIIVTHIAITICLKLETQSVENCKVSYVAMKLINNSYYNKII